LRDGTGNGVETSFYCAHLRVLKTTKSLEIMARRAKLKVHLMMTWHLERKAATWVTQHYIHQSFISTSAGWFDTLARLMMMRQEAAMVI
jgi:hypothetical protein